MQVDLIQYTPFADETCGIAAAKCYNAKNPKSALIHATASGHSSVTEHCLFTFEIRGVSRALLAQLTRHRLASFSVQSQRYVNMGEMPCVKPSTIADDVELDHDYEALLEAIRGFYARAVEKGVPKEDARYITPQAAETTLIMSANARELQHFFELRCCNRAQWEIRELADRMLILCKKVAPTIFRDAGPGCICGKCPEGAKCCGHPRTRDEYEIAKEDA